MTNPLLYTGNDGVPKGTIRISPSSFDTFVNKPYQWYRERVLGEDGFLGNTASVLGTVVHLCAEKAAKGEPIAHDQICDWIDELPNNEDVDKEEVKEAYRPMAVALVNDYVLMNRQLGVEEALSCWLSPTLTLRGTIDALEGSIDDTMIVDYKSYSSTTKPKAIPMRYKYQLLCYAYLAKQDGYNPTRIRLVYVSKQQDKRGISEKTGKPIGKVHPSEVTVLTEEITYKDLDFIESLLYLCKYKLIATERHPELTRVIWHDPRL